MCARSAGVPDLLNYITASNNTGVQNAVNYMIPYATGVKPWTHQDIGNQSFSMFTEQYCRAVSAWPQDADKYSTVARSLPEFDPTKPVMLFWPLV